MIYVAGAVVSDAEEVIFVAWGGICGWEAVPGAVGVVSMAWEGICGWGGGTWGLKDCICGRECDICGWEGCI